MKKSAILFLCSFLLLSLSQKPKPADYQPAINSISAQAIQAHMRFLSSDFLYGRLPGKEGYKIASEYMVSNFARIGLLPAGEDSSYFQDVILSRFTLDYAGSAISVVTEDENKLLTIDENYFIYSRYNLELSSEEDSIFFTGFGKDYPDYNYLPLENLETRGKMLVMLLGNPDFIQNSNSIRLSEKIEKAESLGAKGVLLIPTPSTLETYTWGRLKYLSGRGFEVKGKNTPKDFFAAVIHPDAADEVTGLNIDSLVSMANNPHFQSFVLEPKLSYHINVDRDETLTVSPNVIAKLPGADPNLKDEFVVYTAHLDHVGVEWPAIGDSIYNGAYDNASGCAILLEIAGAFKSLPNPPSRSILFIALTAEEIGLFGSRYFVKYPTVPIKDIVANLNVDMVLMEKPLENAVALGKEYVDWEDMVEETAKEIGISFIPDPMPQERLFMRSDHFSFVQKGIPALFIINDLTDSVNNAWFRNQYHSTRDEFRENMIFEAGAKHARLNFLLGYKISENPKKPEWKIDSPYGRQ